jgi:predicted transposase/invertase (TIGR01784 family)
VRYYLPEDFVETLDLTDLEIVKESFIDEELRQYFSDLLIKVRLKQGGEVFIYILLEHKSSPDDMVALQLLVYLAQIWRPNLRTRTKPLPLVFPVVFYHGDKEWNVSRSFQSLFDFTGLEALRELTPEFKHLLCDLSKLEVTAGGPRLRAGLTTLKYVFSAELTSRLREIFETIKQLPEALIMEYIETVLTYLSPKTGKISPETAIAEIEVVFPDKEGSIMQSLAETWIQEGMEKGLEKGEQKGVAKQTLRMLHRKFGILEAELQERIRSLAIEQLENLGDALLDLQSKESLLAWLQTNASVESTHPRKLEEIEEMKPEAQP